MSKCTEIREFSGIMPLMLKPTRDVPLGVAKAMAEQWGGDTE